MDKEDVCKKIASEEDYIRCPKCNNSLTKFLAKNSEGVDNNIIARLLMTTEDKVEQIYAEAIAKLREEMTENEDE